MAVQGALDELVDSLTSTDATKPGSSRIGADAVPGIPYSLMPGNLNVQVSFLLKWLNAHLSAATQAHAAAAISAATHNYVTAQNVQSQLQEIVTSLLSTADMSGASRIGNSFVGGIPRSIPEGTLRDQLGQLLGHINAHIIGQDHDSRYYPKTDADARYYQVNKKVGDADTLDGAHATAFANALHSHDDRYLRRIHQSSVDMPAKSGTVVATLDNEPELIFLRYAEVGSTGVVDPTWHVNGPEAANVQATVTRVDLEGGRIAFKLALHNVSDKRLMVSVGAYLVRK